MSEAPQNRDNRAERPRASVSRTIAAPVQDLWRRFTEVAARADWLESFPLDISTSREHKALRGVWNGDLGGRLIISFDAEADGPTTVRIEHTELQSAEDARAMQNHWSDALDRLEEAAGR